MNAVRGCEVLTGVSHLFPPWCFCQLASDQSLALSLRPGRNIRRDLENKDCKVSALTFKSFGFSSLRSLRKPTTTSTNSSLTVVEKILNPSLSLYFLGQTWRGNTNISSGFGDPREKRPVSWFPQFRLGKNLHVQGVLCEANRPGEIHGVSSRPSLIPQNTMREHPKVSGALWLGCGRERTASLRSLGTMAVRLDSHRVTPMDLTDGGQGSLEM